MPTEFLLPPSELCENFFSTTKVQDPPQNTELHNLVRPSPLFKVQVPIQDNHGPISPVNLRYDPMCVSNPYPILKTSVENDASKTVGVLTLSERKKKIEKYLEKRKRRIWNKKVAYDCRKKVADKRLRIKGRFVTHEQAYSILGMSAEDLSNNELLNTFVRNNSNCSIMTLAHNMKVRNIQNLINPPNDKKSKREGNKKKGHKIGRPNEDNQSQMIDPRIEEDYRKNNNIISISMISEIGRAHV